ncbi:MAG: pyrroline-5-carboxylate reductase [Hydrogenothermaceae bacterium]|nr:pyrroline-5-carboxylate reductase [Hydrogenothermaceae bacterium]
MFKIGIIGIGNMGQAILEGLIKRSGLNSSDIIIYDLNKEKIKDIVEKYEVAAASDVGYLVNLSEIIFIAVKPKDFEDSVKPALNYFNENKTVISVMAGVPIYKIKSVIGSSKIIRTMPNTPALIGEGVIGVSFDFEEESKKREITKLLSSLGEVIEVKEELMDSITGLSGSGPAYVFTFIDALAMAGVKIGFSYQGALKIATQTVLGTAKLLKETAEHPAVLRDKVTSPAGTTIYGLHKLEEKGFKDAIISAVEEATNRSKQLSK